MNKKLIALLAAALLLVSVAATACNNNNPKEDDTTGNTGANTTDDYIVIGTDESGNDVTRPNNDLPIEPGETQFDPSETNPTFKDVTMKVVVFSAVATVRSETVLGENGVGWPSEGRVLDATGESDNWYRVTYEVNGKETDCYIAKTVAGDAAALEGFTEINDVVTIATDAVNVRSYPSAQYSLSIRGSLKKGDKVTRVAVGEKWSRIQFEVTSETETDASGQAKKEIKEYYVSNDCLVLPAADTAATTTAAAGN